MAEYIKRSQAIKELTNAYEYEYPTASGAFDEFATTIVPNVLKNLPAADVVEVVRCSECKYFGKELKQGKHSCLNYQLPYCLENDYCSYGERLEADGDKNG